MAFSAPFAFFSFLLFFSPAQALDVTPSQPTLFDLAFLWIILMVSAGVVWGATRYLRRMVARSQSVYVQNALEIPDVGYYLRDLRRRREEISPGLRRMLGLGDEMADIQHFVLRWEPAGGEMIQQALSNLAQEEMVKPFQLSTLDGRHRFECRGHVTRDARRRLQALVLWFYDITAHSRAAQQISQTSENLKSEMHDYSTILNMAPYAIWQRGEDLSVRYYNITYGEIAEESAMQPNGMRGAPELDARARHLAKLARDAGEPKSERRHIVIGGERRLFQISEFPVPEEHVIVGFAHDVTEVETLHEELERHISAQSDLLESSASAMAIYGPDMRLKTFNYAFVTLWRFDEVWLESQPSYSEILEALREKRKLPEQANFQVFKQHQLRLFNELIEPHEEFFYLPDGKVLRVIAIPHALGGILFAYEDVTDRLALERSYNTLIAVQKETLDHLNEGVVVFGEDGRLKLCNPRYLKLWNIDREFAESEPHLSDLFEKCKPLYYYDNWEIFKKRMVVQSQERELRHHRVERTDGKVIDWTAVPLPDGATLVTFLDVTDSTLVERSLREKNEALQEADRLKSEFLANVSYELRSPLTSIKGFSEMLKQEYFGALSEKQKEYVEGIHQSSQHLMELINDILDLSSIEAGYMRLDVSRFEIYAMMQSVLSLIQERVKEFNIKVKFECPQKIGKMLGDETRMKQILFNLLSNAINYSRSGDTIVFGAADEKDDVILWVEDQGEGISVEEQRTVFERFFKGSNQEALKHKTGHKSGTGLGLSIVKSFVELHGGNVQLVSAPGKGTRVTCRMPRANPALQEHLQPKRAARR